MLKLLKRLLSPSKPDFSAASRNEPCPCGSGQKYKVCHWDEVRSKQREKALSTRFTNPRG